MEIKLFKAGAGDSFLIKIMNKYILIDGGEGGTFEEIKNEILNLDENLNLVVLTHYDNDHLMGIIKLFRNDETKDKIDRVWANLEKHLGIKAVYQMPIADDTKRSGVKACALQTLIPEEKLNKNPIEVNYIDDIFNDENFEMEIINPTSEGLIKLNKYFEAELLKGDKDRNTLTRSSNNDYFYSVRELLGKTLNPDKNEANNNSIVLLFKAKDGNYLFTGDCSTQILKERLIEKGYSAKNKLKLNLFKLPHHGSQTGFDTGIFDLIECENYFIQAGPNHHGNPSKEMFVKFLDRMKSLSIIPTIITNYDSFKGIEDADKDTLYKYDELKNFSYKLIEGNRISFIKGVVSVDE